jgi:hypothetical protein
VVLVGKSAVDDDRRPAVHAVCLGSRPDESIQAHVEHPHVTVFACETPDQLDRLVTFRSTCDEYFDDPLPHRPSIVSANQAMD